MRGVEADLTIKSAAVLIEGEQWKKALGLFMERRQKLSQFLGPEREEKILREGTLSEISDQPFREPKVSGLLPSGRQAFYQLPNQSDSQIHTRTCKKPQLRGSKRVESSFSYSSSVEVEISKSIRGTLTFSGVSKDDSLKFANELKSSRELNSIIERHGGFWLSVLGVLSEELLRSRGEVRPLISGTYEFQCLDESIQDRMAKEGVRASQVADCIMEDRIECPCVGFQTCLFCSKVFTPNTFDYVQLRLGARVCSLCAKLASDGIEPFPWLEMSKTDVAEQIDFGLRLQQNLHDQGALNFNEAPQHDSQIAFKKLRLHSLSDTDFVQAFLTVAVRPKEVQARVVFGFWEQMLYEYFGSSITSYVGLDGHACRSAGEKKVCDYLSQLDIEHAREPKYSDYVDPEWDPLVRHFKGDFEVGGVIYEYAGMTGDAAYDKKLQIKLNEAKKLGVRVVVIYPRDLTNLPHVFIPKGEQSN